MLCAGAESNSHPIATGLEKFLRLSYDCGRSGRGNSCLRRGLLEVAVGRPFLQQLLFKDQPHHMVGYRRELTERMPAQGRVLDLGCGDNQALAEFRTPQREVWGVDFQEHPQLAHPAWFRLLGPDGNLPFGDNTFDLIHALWVLEHVRDPAHFLGEIQRVLVPGGCLIAHTISGTHYVTWIRRLIGLLPHGFNQLLVRALYGRACHDTFPTHYRLNTKRSLEQHPGLALVHLARYVDPGYFSFFPPLRSITPLADWLFAKLAPGWGQIYLTATLLKPLTRAAERRNAA